MIVLSVGMPRAGSGWHYNLIHELMRTAGSVDAREIRQQYRLQDILTEVNCNIGVLSARRLVRLMIPALQGKTFVIKAHSAPTIFSRSLRALGLLCITYIYRDPRDAMLSAYDYGQRALDKGHPNAFSPLTDFHKSLDFMLDYVKIWGMWMKESGVFKTRYEDLMLNYEAESDRLVKFLKLERDNPEVRRVVDDFRPGSTAGQQGLHFYKAEIGRFRKVYDSEQQRILQEKFGKYLSGMGYAL